MADNETTSKKVQVTLPLGIYEIIQDLKERVYKTDSDSAVCASIIESYLNQQGYTRIKLEEKARK
jgi:CRISPR/Cas system-associated protein Csm6